MPDDGLLDLDNQLCFALYATTRRVVRAYTEALQPLDLTYPQYLVLLVLWEWARDGQGRPTVKALGDRLELDSGTLTPLLRRLQAKRLLTRHRSDTDEREVWVRLTTEGRRLKRRARSIPLTLGTQCSLPLEDLLSLRDQLNRLRRASAA